MTAIICMATFNGERWIDAQLVSLQQQSDSDWKLLVRDDGSGDETLERLARHASQDPRIELLTGQGERLGACGNFEKLLLEVERRGPADDDLILLCDQDDCWSANKIELQRRALANAQGCCSDLALIDARGQAAGGSLLAQLRAPRELSIAGLLAQNSVVGCTLALRPQVLELALPFPEGLRNHDWWLGLCALSLGSLRLIDEPLVGYRQHAGNAVGAYRPLRQATRLKKLLRRQRAVLQSQLQACAVLEERLRVRGMSCAAGIADYRRRLRQPSRLRRCEALLRGEFAAPHRPLRLLRALAALSMDGPEPTGQR